MAWVPIPRFCLKQVRSLGSQEAMGVLKAISASAGSNRPLSHDRTGMWSILGAPGSILTVAVGFVMLGSVATLAGLVA